MASVKVYDKINETDQLRLEARRKTRKRVVLISLSSIVLIAVVVGAVVGTTVRKSKGGDSASGGAQPISTAVKAVCDSTLYPDSCLRCLLPLAKSNQIQPGDVFKLSLQVAMDELSRSAALFFSKFQGGGADKMSVAALETCREALDLALDHMNISLSSSGDLTEAFDDLQTWLSAAGTFQQTCIDGFDDASTVENLKTSVLKYLQNSTEYTSNSLAIINQFSNIVSPPNLRRRRLMVLAEMPEWVSRKDRRLIESGSGRMKVDVVVAKDGSGKYQSIKAALAAVPEKSKKRLVIYVKKGVYYENVRVEKKQWNVMMIGDGKDKTIVSGGLNFVDGTPTFQTATFAVFGKGFIAEDMAFVNTAGPAKHQAVALISTADESVFYRCRFDAFQDTLYAHSNRQFYRECDISGTVDFIFGNSAVVFQNCNILAKAPMRGQMNTITAQGKMDPNQNTGISIQNCTISPSGDLNAVQTFLGRPWKNYSTTVIMQSIIGSFVDPTGWLPWTGNSAPDTIFYAEFENRGPGSWTKKRVSWKGLRNITRKQASKFTVKPFISGDKWLPATGVEYKPDL
ncbi:probable pectinesterase/pectinesterase inhibitor 46 [Diospyros lotus]|uniref:probable pectinesterase/pectinesterase inhibitor 46 n=1 Tax=Diospyros lotus TaxID=55363 RepID=UPI00224CEC68|nr:probable pectinesterase/pectinesterase inhibitor 46 [Diospyros lotus]